MRETRLDTSFGSPWANFFLLFPMYYLSQKSGGIATVNAPSTAMLLKAVVQ